MNINGYSKTVSLLNFTPILFRSLPFMCVSKLIRIAAYFFIIAARYEKLLRQIELLSY